MQKKHNILHPPKQVAFEQLFRLFFKEGEVTEIRALGLTDKGPWEGWTKCTVSGYFDNPVEFAKAAESLDKLKKATGIYFVLNPVNPTLLARANNRLIVPKNSTTDEHAIFHRWLLIDADPVRPSGISATDQEILLATNRINKITAFLQENSFPEPIKCNSGNGTHAIYRLPDLPNSQETTELKAQALQALQHKFGSKTVDIDLKVFNPSRITKLYATWARKGDSIPDRPHRQSFIEHIPEPIQPVTLEQLEWLASLAPKEKAPAPVQLRVQPSNNSLGGMDFQAYLNHYSVEISRIKQESGRVIYGLKHCVFNPKHVNNESSIIQMSDGKLLYQCFHNSCRGRTWHEARQVISGDDSLASFCAGYEPSRLNKHESSNIKLADTVDKPEEPKFSEWDKTRELFPRLPFPWNVLPEEIANSLKQLARSHATSPLSIPGAAMAIFGSVLGSTVNISPKTSWREPLIFWFADIRPSGSGKTPAMRALCSVLYRAQTQADEDYKQRLEEERAKKKKDQRPVPRAKSYFITDLTLEGLRADSTGHGGSVCVLDELSSFINGQNQYKAKGNDRESWIALHDGNPARIVRAKESFTISGSRISIVGGIQPAVWQVSFGSEKGLFLTDGTVYRFLATYEGGHDQFYKFTNESWSDQNRKNWEQPLTVAMEWADAIIADEDWKPKVICLSDDAQELFFDWCNRLHESKSELPDQFKGYLPKLIGYSLRLAGVLYCMNHFATGSFPGLILEREAMQKGIDAVTFYAGHIVDAAQALCSNKQITPFEITEQAEHLTKTLESLRSEVDSGRLAVGYIWERFNQDCDRNQSIKTPHAMGTLLRQCGLTILAGTHDANGKRSAKCLTWDKKTESFLEQSLHSLHSLHSLCGLETQDVMTTDIKKTKSAKSVKSYEAGSELQTMQTLKKQSLYAETPMVDTQTDYADYADFVSKENKKTELQTAEFDEGMI